MEKYFSYKNISYKIYVFPKIFLSKQNLSKQKHAKSIFTIKIPPIKLMFSPKIFLSYKMYSKFLISHEKELNPQKAINTTKTHGNNICTI